MPYFDRNYCKAVNLGSALVLLFILFLFALMTSCTTQRKVEKWNAKHPVKAASYCQRVFPPVEWVEVIRDTLTDTLTLTEKEWVFDTLYVDGKPVTIGKPCPPSRLITKVIRDTIKTRVRDSAAIFSLQGHLKAAEDLIEADKRLIKAQDDLIASGRGLLLKLGIIILLLLLWIFRRPILNLLNPIKKFYPF